MKKTGKVVAAILLMIMVVISISGCAPKNKVASKPQNADQYTFNLFTDQLQTETNKNITDLLHKLKLGQLNPNTLYTRTIGVSPSESIDVYDGDRVTGYTNNNVNVMMFTNSTGKVWHVLFITYYEKRNKTVITSALTELQYSMARVFDKKLLNTSDAVVVMNQLTAKDTLDSGNLLKTTKNGITYTMQYFPNEMKCRADIYKSGV